MRRSAALTRALAALTLTLAVSTTLAAPNSKFEPNIQVQGTALLLNGAGTRYKTIFQVYDMGLYTSRKVTTADALLALDGPKALRFVALRELPGTDLGRLFIKGLSENSPKETVQKHTLSSTRFIEIFSGKPKLVPGDTFAMEYLPGKGTQFYISGKPQGAPVGDAEFFAMVLKIWVGPSPADSLLKDALLGVDR